jgi:hypothetical protein
VLRLSPVYALLPESIKSDVSARNSVCRGVYGVEKSSRENTDIMYTCNSGVLQAHWETPLGSGVVIT